ncbi:hypothetical protein [Chryseobacterium koreense]|uniref:hypothetical protein n=1 Tax=Chryseobacterium koreense TaxID=232216 RepID=UPI0026ECF121|nr:hypothetical protein [Chryseobacterium koreense]
MKKLLVVISLGVFTFGFSQSDYYNDYQRSINTIDWTDVVNSLFLSANQQNQLMTLNSQYPNYDSWTRVYGNNPMRWRTDRYSKMEEIMGKDKYVKFKNKYYKGQNPVAVYNRNKNNYKKDQNNKYKNYKDENDHGEHSHKMKEYKKRKKSGDGSHLWIKNNKSKQDRD